MSNQAKDFKHGVDPLEARRRREENAVKIRKDKREQLLKQRRNITEDEPESSSTKSPMKSYKPQDILEWARQAKESDPNVQFHAVQSIRRVLAIESHPPIDAVIESGVVPVLIDHLRAFNQPKIQFEAAWALTNIASGTHSHTEHVAPAIPYLVTLMSSPTEEVREQAIWALGNIAGDHHQYRDMILSFSGIFPLITQLNSPNVTNIRLLRNATWTLSNLCRGQPPPNFELVHHALPVLARLISSTDAELLIDACWALSYLSLGKDQKKAAVISQGVVPRLIQLLLHNSVGVQAPALRTIGNLVTGSDEQTDLIIKHGALPALFTLLTHTKKAIRREACWTISNITAGTEGQIQEVINMQMIPALVHIMRLDDSDVQREAGWAVANAISGGNDEQVKYIVSQKCIEPLCNLLQNQELRVVIILLEAVERILKLGKKLYGDDNAYSEEVEECGGLDTIERLQDVEDREVYTTSHSIVTQYFSGPTDQADMGVELDQQGQFAFNAEATQDGSDLNINI